MDHMSAPWSISGEFDADVSVTIMSADEYEICEIHPMMGDWLPEEIVNARLIAAAPELLAALRDAVPCTGDLLPLDARQARAAIAKAEGTA